jgi:two-component system, chemotaxis family, protein-glutamate methylesterase/glutaminase
MSAPVPIRVLIVDDSAFVRKAVRRMLAADEEILVVGEASDGRRGLDLARELEPDVITLDLRMPGWDGMSTLARIMQEAPTSIVILSSFAHAGAELTLKALTAGAVDFIDKSRVSTMALYELEREIVDKLKAAARSSPMAGALARRPRRTGRPRTDLFVLGASTGGPRALQTILDQLPEDLRATILVVQHMPAGFTGALADRLNETCALPVAELSPGDLLAPGAVHVAPGGADVRLEASGNGTLVRVEARPRGGRTAPSIDLCLEGAAGRYGERVCAVILTGMGDDGLEGSRIVREAGGYVIAEAASTCVVYGMPKTVAEAGFASAVAPLDEIPGLMLALAGDSAR